MIDKPTRSFVKAVTWRVTGTLDTILISFLITGKLPMALSIGGIEVFTKILIYYFHERIWERIKYGRGAPEHIEFSSARPAATKI